MQPAVWLPKYRGCFCGLQGERACKTLTSYKYFARDVLTLVSPAAIVCRHSRGRRRCVAPDRQPEIFQLPVANDERTFSEKIAVEQLEGRGCGIVARAPITRGDIVLREAPLLGLPDSFKSDIDALLNSTSLQQLDNDLNVALKACSQADQGRFWQLSDCHAVDKKTAAGIALTNALQLGRGGGLLLVSARFNHSCKPNVQGRWDQSQPGGMAVWHALRDISIGEELCFSYVDPYDSEIERQSILQKLFKFKCRPGSRALF